MILVVMATALAEDPVDLVLRGVCDGSTAVMVRPGKLLVAYDEDRSLHSYDVAGGDSLGEHSLDAYLKVPDDDEYDLEASALVGESIWWLGSHGNNRRGRERPSRRVLFTTSVPEKDDLTDLTVTRGALDVTSTVSKGLPNKVMGRPPKEGGLNLEGLEVHPEGGLLVGLRSPLTSDDGMTGEATVLRLKPKPSDEGVVFRVKKRYRVDLEDRGVRSLAWDGDRLLILAGPVGFGGPFDIYAWDLKADPKPLGVDLVGLNPESLVPVGEGRWLVLSDDGAVKRSDWASDDDDGLSDCKDIRKDNPQGADHPSVYARGRLITLP